MYKYTWLEGMSPGYVVYRGNQDGSAYFGWIMAHRVALFVTAEEAKDYCEYRNSVTKIVGSDAIDLCTELRRTWAGLHSTGD